MSAQTFITWSALLELCARTYQAATPATAPTDTLEIPE